MATNLFEQIEVNLATGKIAYPKLPGFELDLEKVYRVAELFLPHCNGNLKLAVKQAIHGQLTAHQGACQLFPKLAKGGA